MWQGVLPHEIGHSVGRPHTPYCGTYNRIWYYPYADGHISAENSGDNAFFGFHIWREGKERVYGPQTGDLMSYCWPVWPSDWTYESLHGEISRRFGSSSTVVETTNAASSSALLISGLITPTLSTGRFESIYEFSLPGSIPVATSGSYALRLEDGSNNVLVTYPFEPDNEAGAFVLTIPFDPQVARISLLHGQEV